MHGLKDDPKHKDRTTDYNSVLQITNHTQREVWPLPLATGRWSLGPWDVLADNFGFILSHTVSAINPDGNGDEKCQLFLGVTRDERLATQAVNYGAPVRSVDAKAQLRFSNILQIVTHHCQESNSVHNSMGRGRLHCVQNSLPCMSSSCWFQSFLSL